MIRYLGLLFENSFYDNGIVYYYIYLVYIKDKFKCINFYN